MAKLPLLSYQEICRILGQNGLTDQRVGPHVTCIDPAQPTRRASVPRHREVSRGTLRAIIRDARKDREEFLSLAAKL